MTCIREEEVDIYSNTAHTNDFNYSYKKKPFIVVHSRFGLEPSQLQSKTFSAAQEEFWLQPFPPMT